jgi:hypothetical protein
VPGRASLRRILAMARKRRRPWLNAVITLAFLLPVAAVVIYSSFHVSDFECQACLSFDGRTACGTVTAKTDEEGRRAAIDNACGQLASGVTDTLRCSRTRPTTAKCRSLGEGAAPGAAMPQ